MKMPSSTSVNGHLLNRAVLVLNANYSPMTICTAKRAICMNYLEKIEMIVFDFDGVLTNNLVFVDQDGKESVSCNRSDGLAFDVLRKLKKPSYILSTEKNPDYLKIGFTTRSVYKRVQELNNATGILVPLGIKRFWNLKIKNINTHKR